MGTEEAAPLVLGLRARNEFLQGDTPALDAGTACRPLRSAGEDGVDPLAKPADLIGPLPFSLPSRAGFPAVSLFGLAGQSL